MIGRRTSVKTFSRGTARPDDKDKRKASRSISCAEITPARFASTRETPASAAPWRPLLSDGRAARPPSKGTPGLHNTCHRSRIPLRWWNFRHNRFIRKGLRRIRAIRELPRQTGASGIRGVSFRCSRSDSRLQRRQQRSRHNRSRSTMSLRTGRDVYGGSMPLIHRQWGACRTLWRSVSGRGGANHTLGRGSLGVCRPSFGHVYLRADG